MEMTDADGSMVLLADIKEGDKAVVYLLQLLGIFLIGILQMLESTCCIHIVSRIDAYFFYILCRHVRYLRIEVNVGHKRHHISVLT